MKHNFPGNSVGRRAFLGLAIASASILGLAAKSATASDDLTVGLILPLSGTYADQGAYYEDGARLYQKMHGTEVAGRDVKLVVRDDQGPGSGDLSRRLTQELILREGAEVIIGYSFTPNAMAAAGMLTEAKTPGIIVNAMTSVLTEKSPYVTRISATMAQVTNTLGGWAADNGIGSVYTIVTDYAPGIDAETWFIKGFTDGGGEVLGSDRTPITAMEYGPFLQRAIEAKPEAIFAFNPGGDVSVAFMKQAADRLEGTGIQLLVTGDVVDENLLPAMGEAAEGVISAWHYQTDVETPANAEFIAAFKEEYGMDKLPSYRLMQGYDALALVYKALEATGGKTGDDFVEAMKGMELASPRGPVLIDPETRDIIENIYIRKGEVIDGVTVNKSFATVEAVKDPAK